MPKQMECLGDLPVDTIAGKFVTIEWLRAAVPMELRDSGSKLGVVVIEGTVEKVEQSEDCWWLSFVHGEFSLNIPRVNSTTLRFPVDAKRYRCTVEDRSVAPKDSLVFTDQGSSRGTSEITVRRNNVA